LILSLIAGRRAQRKGQEKVNVLRRDRTSAKVVEFPKGIGSLHWTISATG
jgi:hypothetical protein